MFAIINTVERRQDLYLRVKSVDFTRRVSGTAQVSPPWFDLESPKAVLAE